MRYYKIVITDANGKLVTVASSIAGTGATYTSFVNNKTIPNALQIELDIPLAAYATPTGDALIRIWGISLKEISQASQFNPKNKGDPSTAFRIAVYAGMQKGLPLANPNQAQLIVNGSIFQAFGNWVGTDMTLDFIIAPFIGTNAAPKNLSLNWKAGTSFKDAIEQTLKTGFPGTPAKINISPDLVINHDEPGFYHTLEQFAAYVKDVSISIIGGSYTGVNIFLNNGTFEVDDQTTVTAPKPIMFQDLIGQPTWIEALTIQFKCVMRGDISIGDYVKLPPAIVTTQAAASSSLVNLKSAFEGSFYVNYVRHVGNFRQPDAASWISTFNAVTKPQQKVNTAHSR